MKLVVQPWWVLALRGSLAVVFASSTALFHTGLGGLVALFGGYALIDGALSLLVARARFQAYQPWRWGAVEGALGVSVGVMGLFAGPVMPAGLATALIASWAVGRGLVALIEVLIAWHAQKTQGGLPVPLGLPSLSFGLVLLLAPGEGGLAGPLWISAFALLLGLGLWARAARAALQGLEQPGLAIALPAFAGPTASAMLRAMPIRWRTRARWQAPR
jgi:hypothetical protein